MNGEKIMGSMEPGTQGAIWEIGLAGIRLKISLLHEKVVKWCWKWTSSEKNNIDLLWILMARQVRIADLYEWWRICMDFFIESSTNNDETCGSNDIICQPICQPTPENHEDHLGPKSPIFMFVGSLLQRFILQRWCQVQTGSWNSKAPVSWAKLG